jgi:hypothetical protein
MKINSILNSPSFLYDSKGINPDDIASFPPNLRFRITLTNRGLWASTFALAMHLTISVLFGWRSLNTSDQEWLSRQGAALICGLGLICLCVNIYLAYFKIQRFEKSLERSLLIDRNRQLAGNCLKGWLYRLKIIRSAMYSRQYFKAGDVNTEDIKNFPVSYKRWLTWPGYAFLISSAIVIVTGVLFNILA